MIGVIYVFLADGFEEIEALAAVDVLRRAELEVKTVGVGSKTIAGAHGINVEADITDGEAVSDNLEMIVLPGGMPGTLNLEKSPSVQNFVSYAVSHDLWIGAICAAPSILGHAGVIDNKKVTCYPGFESELKGALYTATHVERDGKLITARGPGAAVEFALELVKALCGSERAKMLGADAMYKYDIREYKRNLRAKYKGIRRSLTEDEKNALDENIKSRVCRLYQYRNADTVLCYVSTPIEVNTVPIIEQAIQDGKRVAVPLCIDNTREMDFYYINSMDDLAPRTFGVLEPIEGRCEKVVDFSGSICIIPGLAFDFQGFRLGYGKGYYDRFLCNYPCQKIGMVYESCMQGRLPHGRFDIPVDVLVTERGARKITLK